MTTFTSTADPDLNIPSYNLPVRQLKTGADQYETSGADRRLEMSRPR